MNGLAERLSQLSPKKQELLLRHLAAKRSPAATGDEIRPRAAERTHFSLSFAQQRLWLVDRLRPGSSAYNIFEALRLTGALDLTALRVAFGEILSRHEVLRATFALEGDEPVQVILPAGEPPLAVLDLAALPPAAREGELLRLAAAEAVRPFDLARGPLCRFHIVHLGTGDHALLLALHHIACDAWSMEILFGEVRALYAAFAARRRSPLPALPVQYTDFAEWQRAWLAGERLERQLGWWRQRLAGAPSSLTLPTDRPRPALQTYEGARHHLAVPQETGSALAALAMREGATPYMLFLAAFAALLSRSTSQDDLLVGSPVANRTRPEVERLIGFFVNTLVLRIDLQQEPDFRTLLARVRGTCLEAFANADLPFERIVEEVQPERDLGRTPLFQAVFSVQSSGPAVSSGLSPGVAVDKVKIASRTAKFDLNLVLIEAGGRFLGSLEYNTDLFDPATVARMAGHFLTLLAGVARAPDLPVNRLPLLGPAELQQVLVEWNDGPAAPEAWDILPARFAAQAARQPEALALIAGEREVRYGELDRLAGRLAALLRNLGVGPEVRVAICLERSPAMVAAVLGVWKAGGAYLALDPDLPPERAATLLAASGAALVLTREPLCERFTGFPGMVLCLEEDTVPGVGPAAPCGGAPGPDELAYVVYTSGSTGAPKGVLTPHGGVAAYLSSLIELDGLGPGDRVLQLPSLGFDASVRDLFGPLAAGAAVVLASQEQARDPAALLALIARWRVTRLLSVVPTLLRALLATAPTAPGGGAPLGGSVKTLLLSGERLFLADCRRAWEVFGPALEIVNQYGPTECTMTSSRYRVSAEASAPEAWIGRPLPARRFYVLDSRLLPAPAGAPGDLYIGGSGIARGYLDRPDLTAAAFLPDPFGPPGSRLYATGDRVRHRADGNLEFLGRADQQVKVRGLRVEPGEVEAALAAQPGIRQAVVVAAGEAAQTHLVAYLVADVPALPGPAELRRLLAARLPEPMVPSSFVVVDSLPLTPTGKVDRRALAQREPERFGAAVPPRTRLEQELLRLWQELLPVRQPFGVRDSFFELGGNSLLAVRLMARIEERLGRSLPLSVLFEAATIEALAQALRQDGETAASSPLVEIQRGVAGHSRLFLVHPAGGNVLCYGALARHLGYAQPVFGLQDPNFERREQPCFVLPEMAALYVDTVRDVQPHGPYRLGGWSLGGVVAQEMARQLEAAGEEVERLLLIDTRSPATLAAEPESGHSEADLLLWFATQLGVAVSPEDIEALPAAGRFPAVLARAQAAGRLPADLAPDRAHHIFEVYRTEMAAGHEHRPAPCRCRITLFRAAAGIEEESQCGEADPTLGWSGMSQAGLDLEIVPGSHQTLLDEPHVQTLAERIREYFAIMPEACRQIWEIR